MSDPWQLLTLQVAVGPDGDDEEVDQATLRLRRELIDLDIDVTAPQDGGSLPQALTSIVQAA